MRLALASFVTLLLLIPAAATSAQPYRSRENIAEAAHALSEDAGHFDQLISRHRGFAYLRRDAHAFAARAERTHEMIENGTPYPRIVRHLEGLQRDHARLRDALLQSLQRNYESGLLSQWSRVSYDLDRLIVESGVAPSSACAPGPYHRGPYDHRPYNR